MRWSYAFLIFYLFIIITRIWLNASIPNGDVERPSEYDYILHVQLSSVPPEDTEGDTMSLMSSLLFNILRTSTRYILTFSKKRAPAKWIQ